MSPSKSNKPGKTWHIYWTGPSFIWLGTILTFSTHWAKFLIWDINSIHHKLDQDVFCEHSFIGCLWCLSLSLEVPSTTGWHFFMGRKIGYTAYPKFLILSDGNWWTYITIQFRVIFLWFSYKPLSHVDISMFFPLELPQKVLGSIAICSVLVSVKDIHRWIGLREHLQESPIFHGKI